MKIIAKIYYWYQYHIGISIIPKRMYSNKGYSTDGWCIARRHPKKSITWLWAIYWYKPNRFKSYKTFGFSFRRQDIMLKDN